MKRPKRSALVGVEYLAATLDSEGTITFKVQGDYITPCVQIGSTDFRLLFDIQQSFGGGISRSQRGRLGRRPIRYWYMHGLDAAQVLQNVLPFLRTKRAHAKLALSAAIRSSRRKLSEDERTSRRDLVTRMRALNSYETPRKRARLTIVRNPRRRVPPFVALMRPSKRQRSHTEH